MDKSLEYKVLVIEDDREMRDSLIHLLKAAQWQGSAHARAQTALDQLGTIQPDVVLTDLRMPEMDGMAVLKALQGPSDPPVVLITAHGDIPMAVEAMQSGAYGFIEKPFDPRRLLTALRHAAEQHRMSEDTKRLKARLTRLSGLDRLLIGESDNIKKVREHIMDLCEVEAPIMILGETGTGKEVVARALHDLSLRTSGPFIAINCATVAAEHFEATMFGVSGVQQGVITQAHGGTLFLDEIGACPLPLQAKLLRVIETQEYRPLGSDQSLPVDLRVISATNEDLEHVVQGGQFRSDLLYRLNVFPISLPPLRDSRGDVVLLFSHFIEEFSRVYEVHPPLLGAEDMRILMTHEWPGNVRELRHVAERRILAARRGRGSVAEAISPDTETGDVPETLREAVAAFERELIAKSIRTHKGRMDAVAEALGIGRRTLNDKIVKLGLDKNALL